MINSILDSIGDAYSALFFFVINPTGSFGTNLAAWLMIYAVGWYTATNLLAGHELRKKAIGHEFACSRQRTLDKDSCRYNHQAGCWSQQKIRLEDWQKRAIVKNSMGFATVWPLVVAGFVIFGPPVFIGWAVYMGLMRPAGHLAKATGSGIVTGTTMVADNTVNHVIKRHDEIMEHKAITAKKD